MASSHNVVSAPRDDRYWGYDVTKVINKSFITSICYIRSFYECNTIQRIPSSQRDGVDCGRIPYAVEGAKLFVWCMVTGTNERLVPDLLTRLSDQAKRSQLVSDKPA